MKKFDINQNNVNHVLENTKSEKVIVTADGHIFEMKSKNAAVDYCRKKAIEYCEANKDGLIAEEVAEEETSTEDDAVKKEVPLAKKNKAELTAIAVEIGIGELDGKTNAQIVDLIEAAQKVIAEAVVPVTPVETTNTNI